MSKELMFSTNVDSRLDKIKVVVGMSGGVDSTVAAYKLKEMGYDVIGVTMRLWKDNDLEDVFYEAEGGCCSLSAVEDARRVAEKIGIPFYVINFKDVFKETVVDYFTEEYLNGRTPNPCIACNKYVKFDALIKKAHELGAYYVATGHYAKFEKDEETGRILVKKSSEEKKDQTYAIYNLTQDQLKYILMPLGDFTSKDEVRKIASSFDFEVGSKSDSQEICFVPDNNYSGFVERQIQTEIPKGNFVDTKGNVLGQHLGIIHYTVGQRKGLGLTFGKPMYVVEIRPNTNEVVLGSNDEVFSNTLIADQVNFIMFDELKEDVKLQAKVRYSAKPANCIVSKVDEETIKVVFDEPQRAITPGQAVVFYDNEYLAGGATIIKSIN